MRLKALLILFYYFIIEINCFEEENNGIYYGDTPANFLALPKQNRLKREKSIKEKMLFDPDDIEQTATIPSYIERESDVVSCIFLL